MAYLANKVCRKCFFGTSNFFYKHLHSTNKLYVSKDDCLIRDILFTPIQSEKDKKLRKISIIGAAGNVGQVIANELLLKGISDVLVLSELPEKRNKLCGIALDLLDGTSFKNNPKIKVCSNYEHTVDSDLIVICAGKGVKKGASRLDVLRENADNFRALIPVLAKFSPNSVMVVVSNPVDVMTYAAWKFSGFPKNRILGTGTCLDTTRFKIFLSKKLGISPKYINAYILGEHGQSSTTAWSTVNVAGTRLRDCKACFGFKDDPEGWFDLEKQVKEQANVIKSFKGFTSYAISMVATKLSEAILLDQRTIYPVSAYCKGICGIKTEGFLSLPCVIGKKGVHQIIEQKLDKAEQESLIKSAETLDKAMKTYNW